jgi:putative transposase
MNNHVMTMSRSTEFVSHSGKLLSRSVTFKFTLDPNINQRTDFAKCAGARRFAFNHHLERVKANLDVRELERVRGDDGEILIEPKTPSLSWSGFSFINEFNAWKNGESEDSLVNDDGSRGLSWRHELPAQVFSCASVDAAQALRNFVASKSGRRRGPIVCFPRFQSKGDKKQSFRMNNCTTPNQLPKDQPIRFLDSSHLRLPRLGSIKMFGATSPHDRIGSLSHIFGHDQGARRPLERFAYRGRRAAPPS